VDYFLQNQPFLPTDIMHHTRGLYPSKPAVSPHGFHAPYAWTLSSKTSHFTHGYHASNPWTFSPKNQPLHPRL
jgi:hypothetical protein